MPHIDLGHCDVPACSDCGRLLIEHPPHYTVHAIEPIDVIEAWGLPFHLANVVKYIARYRYKGTPLEDLRKARWYLDRGLQWETRKREGR